MYTEFLAATIEACGKIEDDRLAEAFDRLDCDDTGYSTCPNKVMPFHMTWSIQFKLTFICFLPYSLFVQSPKRTCENYLDRRVLI